MALLPFGVSECCTALPQLLVFAHNFLQQPDALTPACTHETAWTHYSNNWITSATPGVAPPCFSLLQVPDCCFLYQSAPQGVMPLFPQHPHLICCSTLCCRALSNTFYPSVSAAPAAGAPFTPPLQTAWSLEALMGASLNL